MTTIGPTGVHDRDECAPRIDLNATLPGAAALLRLSLSEAVAARVTIAALPTVDCSGGLDSTSLAFLAMKGTTTPLPVLTSVTHGAPDTDDVAYARRHVSGVAELDQHIVHTTPEYLPYQVLGPTGDVPHGSAVAMGAVRARLALAAELGSDMHLTGEGGDVVVGASPAYLADLARRGEVTRLWRDCVVWARLRHRSPLALFRRASKVAATSRRNTLRSMATTLEHGRHVDDVRWEDDMIGYWPPPGVHWLTRSARFSLAAHARQTAEQVEDHGGIGDSVASGLLHQQARTLRSIRAVGAELGVGVHAPFLDTRVVRVCHALSAADRVDPMVPKPLLRAALKGLVPEHVLSRPTKGDYTRDAYLGIRRAAPVLRRLLAESAAADHGLVEPGPVREALEAAVQGLPTPWGALNQAIAVEVWLRERDNRPVREDGST
ncbi:MAG TPA: asparagine synthase-related protein [Pseudonocardiaceae bacterium]|nr:asparagine synthase-related protein [Pseudonocardiaceae bacterium]